MNNKVVSNIFCVIGLYTFGYNIMNDVFRGDEMIKTVVYDLYGTLFDIDSVREKCEKLFPGNGDRIAKAWRYKLIEYTHVRQLVDEYKPFSKVIRDSLEYVLSRNDFDYSLKEINECMAAYNQLTPFPEVTHTLKDLSEVDQIIFSNGNKDMIEQVLDNSNITNYFKFILSLESFGVYKPDSNGYALLEENIPYNKDEVLFVSSNKWDIVGAQKFGFQTAWVNRNFSDFEYIEVKPDFELQSLYSIKDLL